MKQYYIVSLKHTSRADSALTLWRPNGRGYCWFREWAGLYTEEYRNNHETADNVFIEKELADRYFMKTVYDQQVRMVLPNLPNILKALGLRSKLMMPAKNRTCTMSF